MICPCSYMNMCVTVGDKPFPPLKLRLGSLNRRQEQVAEVTSGFIEVEAHLLATKTLGDDVEGDTIHNPCQLLILPYGRAFFIYGFDLSFFLCFDLICFPFFL